MRDVAATPELQQSPAAAMRLHLITSWLLAAHAVDLGKTTYNLNLIVEAGKTTYEATRDDAEALLKHAVDHGMGTSVQLLLRGAVDKVKRSLLELEAKQAKESKLSETTDTGPPTTLTNSTVGVRALKSTFAKPKKANALKRITVADFAKAVDENRAASLLKKPLIVEDGVGPSAKIKFRGASRHDACSMASCAPDSPPDFHIGRFFGRAPCIAERRSVDGTH